MRPTVFAFALLMLTLSGGLSRRCPAEGKSDPAEPPLRLLVVFGGDALIPSLTPPKDPLADRRTHEVTSSARGTTVKVNTPGTGQGVATLTFESGPPPMRFGVKLARMPGNDLRALTVTSGKLMLRFGGVGAAMTTRYFDRNGRELAFADGAAYIVKAGRDKDKGLVVELRRRPGATLGKTVSVTWEIQHVAQQFEGLWGAMPLGD